MDDPTSIERRAADAITDLMGPVRPVDDGAIFASITAIAATSSRPPQPFFRVVGMVAAGAVVALFAGFLLINGLTRSEGPTATVGHYQDTMSSVMLEEVAPGISRFAGDNAGTPAEFIQGYSRVAFDPDGAIWIIGDEHQDRARLRRLGVDEDIDLGNASDVFDIAVVSSGELLTAAPSGVAHFDDGAWHQVVGRPVKSFEVMANGTPWTLAIDKRVAGLDIVPLPLGGHAVVEDASGDNPAMLSLDDERPADLAVDADGNVWVGNFERAPDGAPTGTLLRHDGDSWETQDPLAGVPFAVEALAAGTDGALWALLMVDREEPDERPCCSPVLVRFDDGEWMTWTTRDGLPLVKSFIWSATGGVATVDEPGPPFAVAPDGRLWMGDLVRGVISFDGTDFTTYETGPAGEFGQGHATEIAFAPDGSTWVVIWKEDGAGLYIIDPA